MNNLARTAKLGMLVALIGMLSACNTIEGVGRDIESAGDSIGDAANGAK
ncbi:MAG: entericidin A/B family lipoprotein [Blastomonas sp.]